MELKSGRGDFGTTRHRFANRELSTKQVQMKEFGTTHLNGCSQFSCIRGYDSCVSVPFALQKSRVRGEIQRSCQTH